MGASEVFNLSSIVLLKEIFSFEPHNFESQQGPLPRVSLLLSILPPYCPITITSDSP
jgi:hypothetical protein